MARPVDGQGLPPSSTTLPPRLRRDPRRRSRPHSRRRPRPGRLPPHPPVPPLRVRRRCHRLRGVLIRSSSLAMSRPRCSRGTPPPGSCLWTTRRRSSLSGTPAAPNKPGSLTTSPPTCPRGPSGQDPREYGTSQHLTIDRANVPDQRGEAIAQSTRGAARTRDDRLDNRGHPAPHRDLERGTGHLGPRGGVHGVHGLCADL